MFTVDQLKELLDLQEQLEIHIGGEDWRNAGHNYPLCIHMECAEIIDAFGWKHWKNVDATPNTNAIAMELVDVWHFAMAFLLMSDDFDAEEMYTQLLEAIEEYKISEKRDVIDLCIGMGYSMFAVNKFPYGNFIGLMDKIDMSFDQLYVLYISKNVLNRFRQDHGYKEGTYRKGWGGKEDNVHAHELCELLGDELDAELLYDHLKTRYNLVAPF